MLTPKRKGSDYHHGDLKSAAIIVGRNLIETGGIQALGIRRVADTIGVTAPALYRHFDSLDVLLFEISCQVRQELGELMMLRRNSVRKSRDSRKYELDKFKALGEAYVDFAENHPRLFEVAFTHHQHQSIGDYNDLAWQILNESIENFVNLGMTPKSKQEKAPLLAWSAVHGLATLVANRSITPTELDFFRTAVLDGIKDALIAG